MKHGDLLDMVEEATEGGWNHSITLTEPSLFGVEIERFAALIAKHEREECVKLCQEISDDKWKQFRGDLPYSRWDQGCANPYVEGQASGAESCASDIQARDES